MRFATRTFLWSFLPVAILLLATFAIVQRRAVISLRDEVRSSLRRTQISMASMQARSVLQNSRFLAMVADNAPLKAGVQLMNSDPASAEARRTVEDQLREICDSLRFDFLLLSNLDGAPEAGVMRLADQLVSMDIGRIRPPHRGFFTAAGFTYQVSSVAVDQGDESIGLLSVGERFDFSEFSTPVVLTRNGRIVKSNVPGHSDQEIESSLAHCRERLECEVQLDSQTYLSLPMDSIYFGDGYVLRSLQNVDAATGPVQSILRDVFAGAGLAAILAALVLSAVSSKSIVKPLGTVVARLRESAKTGILPEFGDRLSPIQEIRELTEAFNHAAQVIREAEQNLRRANVEFVGSLASALDARDRYTAGHSRRVSEWACAVARAIGATSEQLDEIRIAALLHDIGKIGISDSILQKPGRLTDEEFALIQQHPSIGRRILEGVNGFQRYLPVVELHHENWDGTGYPLALTGENVPLAARIVHVVDAYDAMTSDRPYRRGMTHEEALRVIERSAGTQFDPEVVGVFTTLGDIMRRRTGQNGAVASSLSGLAEALQSDYLLQPR